MSDLFEEVEEQLRSDRYRTLAIKALPWIGAVVVAALLVVAGFWGFSKYRLEAAAKASEQYSEALTAFSNGRVDKAVPLWTAIAKSPASGYKALALMQLGGVKISQNKPAEAVVLFDDAAKAAPDKVIGDIARLKSAFAVLDTAPYKDVEARLKPLMEEGRPYRVQAHEALAFAKLMAGDDAGARGDFVVISQGLDTPQTARARAKAAVDLIDSGTAKSTPAAVKAAAAMPAPALPALSVSPQPQAIGPQ